MDALRIFLAVAALRSFAAAARQLALSPAGDTRAAAALEARLDMRLTTEGETPFARCGSLVRELLDVEDDTAGGRQPRSELAWARVALRTLNSPRIWRGRP